MPIKLNSELEHIRACIAVEQTLYNESLFVEYDMPHTFFCVLPPTLQPVMEAAGSPFQITVAVLTLPMTGNRVSS